MKKPFYQLEQTRDVIRQFTPNWFTMTMGTGVVALILPEFPFAQDFCGNWQPCCGNLTYWYLSHL